MSDWKQKANAEERLQIARKCAKGCRRRAFGAEHCASGHEQAGMEQCFPAVQGMDERALCNNKDKKMEAIKIIRYLSPVGEMMIGSYGGNLNAEYEEGTSEVIEQAVSQLREYFQGERRDFDIPIVFTGSEFQNSVWHELMKVPYGSTISYAELARRIHHPRAVRAVASANATNPISIFVPCHRVIGSNQKLTGYGGGLDAKRELLALEARVSGSVLAL